MSTRILVHAPALLRRRPMRARRAVAQHLPAEYSSERPAPRCLVVGAGILGLITFVLFIVGLVVIA